MLTLTRYCIGPEGEEVLVVPEGATSNEGNNAEEEETPAHAGEHCHFHAGVEYVLISPETDTVDALLTTTQALRRWKLGRARCKRRELQT